MSKKFLLLGVMLLFLLMCRAAGAESAATGKPKESAKANSSVKSAKKSAATATAEEEAKEETAAESGTQKDAGETASAPLTVGSQDSIILSPPEAAIVSELYEEEEGDLVYYTVLENGEFSKYPESEKTIILSDGEVIAVEGETLAGRSYTVGGYTFSLDHEPKKGFFGYVRGGYQWSYLRKTGFNVGDHRMRTNVNKSGGVVCIGIGYDFGPDVPMGLEVDIGLGPELDFHNTGRFGNVYIDSKQKVSLYNLDAAIDYDIKTQSFVTPFIGITTGLTLVTDRGNMYMDPGNGGPVVTGEYGRKHRVNLMGGLRTGAKVQVHENVTLSAIAAYNYMGDIPAQYFTLSDGSHANTKRIRAHEFSLQLGVKVSF